MEELKIIRYSLDEIKTEQNTTSPYEKARVKAEDECRKCGEDEWWYDKYMPYRFDRAAQIYYKGYMQRR